jgi:hypothetical protein
MISTDEKKLKNRMTIGKISNIGHRTFWSTFIKTGYKAMQLPPKERKIVLKGMMGSIYRYPDRRLKKNNWKNRVVKK